MNMDANQGGPISPRPPPCLTDHSGNTASLLVAVFIAFCGGVMGMKIDAGVRLEEEKKGVEESPRSWIHARLPISVGFIEMVEHRGAFLFIEIRGIGTWKALVQKIFDGEFDL